MIVNDRYFTEDSGSPAVSTAISQAGTEYALRIELPALIVASGDANSVLAKIDALVGHLSGARESFLLYLTEG